MTGPEQQDDADAAKLGVGAKVRVHGVKALKHLNGKEGEVLQFDEATGKWACALSNGETRKLKPENLLVLEAAPAPREEPAAEVQDVREVRPPDAGRANAGASREACSTGRRVPGRFSEAISFPQHEAPAAAAASFAAAAGGGAAGGGRALRGGGAASWGADAWAEDPPSPEAADAGDDRMAALERLARQEAERERQILEKNQAAIRRSMGSGRREAAQPATMPGSHHLEQQQLQAARGPPTVLGGIAPSSSLPGYAELMAQLEQEEATPSTAARLAAAVAAPPPRRPPGGGGGGGGGEAPVPSLELVLARLDDAEEEDASRGMFFGLGNDRAEEPEQPQDPLSKMIRLTNSGLDPRRMLDQSRQGEGGSNGASSSGAPPAGGAEAPLYVAGPGAVPFRPRRARWLPPEEDEAPASRPAPLRRPGGGGSAASRGGGGGGRVRGLGSTPLFGRGGV